MGRIPQEIIDRILERADIVEVVSDYIHLKKAGASFKANCPFHNEKTPSFVVSPDKQIFHCFGCGAGGNSISFVMKFENMEFPEAVEVLAKKTGIEIPRYEAGGGEGESMTSKLYELHNMVAAFYQSALRSEPGRSALEYLKKRGITSETMSQFRLGFAPDAWETLKNHCKGKNIPNDLLLKSGLIIENKKDNRYYDRFRNRVIFPIFNEKGQIIAFGGRVLDSSLPKYINSPESPIYNKSSVLYGLNFSKSGIREKGYVILVEGYMDVVVPSQYGITNIVATSGTALTARQVSILKRHSDKAVIIFDPDTAGEAASLRGLDILIENDMEVRIATLPSGDDPDSFVRKNGMDEFIKIADNAKNLMDYKLDVLIRKLGAKDIGGITDEMLPTISRIENLVLKSHYLKQLAERLGIHEASLRHELGKVKPDYSYHLEKEGPLEADPASYLNSEIHLLGLAITDINMFNKIKNELGTEKLRDMNVREAFDLLDEAFSSGDHPVNIGKILSRVEKKEKIKKAIVQALAQADITKDREKAASECILRIKLEARGQILKSLTEKLKEAEKGRNEKEIMDLVKQINEIHKEKVV